MLSPHSAPPGWVLQCQHLGKQQQGAAGLGVCMMVPEVKQLRGEDGRCKESQKEEAAYGQVLDVLPRDAAGESPTPQTYPPPLPAVETEEVKWEMGQKAILSVREASPFGACVSIWKMK